MLKNSVISSGALLHYAQVLDHLGVVYLRFSIRRPRPAIRHMVRASLVRSPTRTTQTRAGSQFSPETMSQRHSGLMLPFIVVQQDPYLELL